MFGRTIRGGGSKQCEGPPFSCRHSLLLLKEQVTEGWQLLLRNLTATFSASKAFRESLSRDGKPEVESSLYAYLEGYIELAFGYLF